MCAHGFFLKQKNKQLFSTLVRVQCMRSESCFEPELKATTIPAVKSKNKQKFEAHVRTWASKRAEHAKTTIKPVNSYFSCKQGKNSESCFEPELKANTNSVRATRTTEDERERVSILERVKVLKKYQLLRNLLFNYISHTHSSSLNMSLFIRSQSASPSAPPNSPRTPCDQVAPRHNARALWSQDADETIELDSMPPSPSSSSIVPLEWPADIRAGQPLVWNAESADRLLSELDDNEPLPSLEDIIGWARAELEAPFISPEAAALAVTAVATTTATTTTAVATTTTAAAATTATRRSTRARRAPERFAPTQSMRPQHYEVEALHGRYFFDGVGYYLVSWVGYDADWIWLAESDLACSSMVRQYTRNIAAADDRYFQADASDTQSVHFEVAGIHGCFIDREGNYWFLLSWAGYKAGWQWVQECDCSCFEVIRAFQRRCDRAIHSWQSNQDELEMWDWSPLLNCFFLFCFCLLLFVFICKCNCFFYCFILFLFVIVCFLLFLSCFYLVFILFLSCFILFFLIVVLLCSFMFFYLMCVYLKINKNK